MRRRILVLTVFVSLLAGIASAGTLGGVPTGHPPTAASGTFKTYRGDFDVYIWKEDGKIWVEIVPKEEMFICSVSFGLVQDDIWYDTVKIETPTGDSFCDDLAKPYVFKLNQYTFYDETADLGRPFRFALEDGAEIYSVYFNPNGSSPPASTFTYYSPYFKSDGWTGLGLSNLSAERANVSVYIYANDGAPLATETKAIDPNGQTHFVTGSVITEDGWTKIVSTKKIAGLCLAGSEGDGSYMADIPMTETLSTSLVIPHVAYGPVFDTTIYISNPNESAATTQITYAAMNGALPYGSHTMSIPANGCAQVLLSDLTSDEMINGGRVNINSSRGVTAFAIYNNLKSGGRSFAGLNAFSTQQ